MNADMDTCDGDGHGAAVLLGSGTRTRMGVGVGSRALRAHFDWSALLGKLYTLMQCETLLAAASQLTRCASGSPTAAAHSHSRSYSGPAGSSSAAALCIGASLRPRPQWSLAAAIERGAGVFSKALVERLLAAPCFCVVRAGDVDGGAQSTSASTSASDDVATAPAAAAASIASALRALTQHCNDEAESLSEPRDSETRANSELVGFTGLAQFHVLFGTSN